MEQTPVTNWDGLLDTLGMLSLSLAEANLGEAANELNAAIASIHAQVNLLNDPNQFSPALLMKLFEEGQMELEAMLWEAIQQSDEDTAPETTRKLSIWIDRVRHQLRRIRIDIQVLAPWLLALANIPDDPQTDDQSELTDSWNALKENLPLHPRLGEIPDICRRASNIIEEVTSLLDVNDKAAFEWFETLTYDLPIHAFWISL
jgi:hypothetical protein